MSIVKYAIVGIAAAAAVAGVVVLVKRNTRVKKVANPISEASVAPVMVSQTPSMETVQTATVVVQKPAQTVVKDREFTEEELVGFCESFHWLWNHKKQCGSHFDYLKEFGNASEFVMGNHFSKLNILEEQMGWSVSPDGELMVVLGCGAGGYAFFYSPDTKTMGWGGEELPGLDNNRFALELLQTTTEIRQKAWTDNLRKRTAA